MIAIEMRAGRVRMNSGWRSPYAPREHGEAAPRGAAFLVLCTAAAIGVAVQW
jgi:hypothetical protein